jgi:hypothetical protein
MAATKTGFFDHGTARNYTEKGRRNINRDERDRGDASEDAGPGPLNPSVCLSALGGSSSLLKRPHGGDALKIFDKINEADRQ